jgi:hypothetical protein
MMEGGRQGGLNLFKDAKTGSHDIKLIIERQLQLQLNNLILQKSNLPNNAQFHSSKSLSLVLNIIKKHFRLKIISDKK